jgi:uracil-DNA glycosylase
MSSPSFLSGFLFLGFLNLASPFGMPTSVSNHKALSTPMDTNPNLALMAEMSACRVCASHLPLGPRPVARVSSPQARILIIGQAPGTKVHASGVPWDDASGARLRGWMGLTPELFYHERVVAILPMGLCYPGKAKGGDAPPRRECAPLWHDRALGLLPNRRLMILIGAYALSRYLGDKQGATLGETVRNWREHIANGYFPLVHPSPRNHIWLKNNPWFEAEIVPALNEAVRAACLD